MASMHKRSVLSRLGWVYVAVIALWLLLRAIFFEVGTLSPDADEAARELATTVLGSVGAYVMKQMQAGRLRMVHPILALQSFIGPIFFHLMTRPLAERVLGLNMEGEAAVTALAEGWLRSMKPD